MNTQSLQENAVAAIRISSLKQGLQGDSPEAQKEQIERFAETHNIHVSKFFIIMESASGEEQPVQEAIDYCKNSKNDIQIFIIKSIDRFTRGGSYLYDHLKMQLERYGVKLVDIYGIIGQQNVNTLEHLGLKYDWSVYSPTKKSEILEAERAKDEMRDIMSRMIGAEIRYTRLGYRVWGAPFGYVNEKVETENGRRVILRPHPEEAKWVLKMYDLRAQGTLSDEEIVDRLNGLGFKSRIRLHRNPKDRTKVLEKRGGVPLTVKQYERYIQRTIYAGVIMNKWTENLPVKCKFDGLISIDAFNKANKGKVVLLEENGELRYYKDKPEDWRTKKLIINPNFPFKRYVLCPTCKHNLYGSASRGKLGKHYPAYHCDKRGHNFRVPLKDFNITITNFVKQLKITNEGIKRLKFMILEEWAKRIKSDKQESDDTENKIRELEAKQTKAAESIAALSSVVAIQLIEKEINKTEVDITNLKVNKKKLVKDDTSMEIVMEVVADYLEHLEFLLLGSPDPIKRAAYFGLVFEEAPTYQDLIFGTPKLAPYIKLTQQLSDPKYHDVSRAGFEPATKSLKGSCSTTELPARFALQT